MKHLIIRNFGPLKEVDVHLKRINLIIGPQSSGKSCVLKIASFCDWLERSIQQTRTPEKYCNPVTVRNSLVIFHRLVGYLRRDSFFSYETDSMHFEYSAESENFSFCWKDGRWNYKRAKIAYIPAERNLVAAIPNWFQVSMNYDNIMDFMKEWEFARKAYDREQHILDLDISYQYDSGSGNDRILLDDGKELEFTMASSGIQSLIPMFVMIDYLTAGYYENPTTTVEKDILKGKLMETVSRDLTVTREKRKEIVGSILNTDHSDLFIEEPEAHIFPLTQKSFVYSLVGMLNRRKSRHNCMLTTHSPYIMTSFNNLLFAGEIAKESEEKAAKIKKIIPVDQWIKPSEIGAYAINDGRLYSIIDEESGLISSEALDSASDEIGRDFDSLLAI